MEQGFLVQYEYEFPNEYTDELVEQIGEIMGIPIDLTRENKMEHIQDYESETEIIRLIKSLKEPKSFILIKFNKKDWYYAIVIRCRESIHQRVKEVLLDLNEQIIEEYGDTPYEKIENVISNKDTLLNKFLERYNFSID
ncbi:MULTISPECIES: hypothetical protein [Bacillus]|uniref:Uncharacterized protein n=1 Tax=Bacillus pseudomycoides TaxID=64104 RepID=A0ABD6T410_9BACI|nr:MULTISPECIES: hypothetical protein [Bacillus]EEM08275.1 hypothetical protein bmyco0003_49870 [Bacillus pseudomycoides]EEM16364.1 hypothetical protein bpmyx0001_27530 [Bacillus pseudomycoides DSM 12442]KFN15797.1 hypothetical protein DJ94_2910 [Bacillus pseudomycoides]MBD5799227.1 hypothetical protein [Bacillus pseudomycoides]MCX2824470.1 hypothetical protein [Bacillus sp. DHT2]